ncbi:MAG TPA: EF-hand domain-containing protein [Sphingomicrobium sp.]|jgi:Ca2+-binding EF-hand superfamily protein|nr:EF-hand domain-containing protein [Sphingomicrobium sp.]
MKPVGFAALLLVAMPVAALAAQQDAKSDVEKPVTKSEVSAKLDADYADMDTNKDGKLTAAEIDARLVKSAEAKIEMLKKERDAAFAKLDANGDGSISHAEFNEKAKLPTIKDADAKPFLDRFDANKDGEISLEEFRTPTMANFARMDLNHDGTVTPAEANAPEKTASAPAKKPTFKNTPSITR